MELLPSNALADLINGDPASKNVQTFYLDLEKCDQGYSYEDTLYLSLECEFMPVKEITELAEELEVELEQVTVALDGRVMKVTFAQHLSEVKWWLAEDPNCNAPYPGMEFETPSNFEVNHF